MEYVIAIILATIGVVMVRSAFGGNPRGLLDLAMNETSSGVTAGHGSLDPSLVGVGKVAAGVSGPTGSVGPPALPAGGGGVARPR